MPKATFVTHLCWLLVALLAYSAGTKRSSEQQALREDSSGDQSGTPNQGPHGQTAGSTGIPSPRSGVPKARRDTAGHKVEELREAGLALLEPFENYQAGDEPFADFDKLDPKARANAIRGLLFSPIGAHDDFADKLMSVLAQHNFSGIDRETLDGIFAFVIADQFTDKTPMQAEAIRRLRNGRHIPAGH